MLGLERIPMPKFPRPQTWRGRGVQARLTLSSFHENVPMKTNLFTYETGLGTFWIRPEPAGRVQLGIGRNKLKTYRSATTAARDVAQRTTGWAPWDNATGERAPTNLQRWKRTRTTGARLTPQAGGEGEAQ